MKVYIFILCLSSVKILGQTFQESSTHPTFTSIPTILIHESAHTSTLSSVSSANPERVTWKPKKLYSWWTHQPSVLTGDPDPPRNLETIPSTEVSSDDPGLTKAQTSTTIPQDTKGSVILTTTEKDAASPEAVTPYINGSKIKGTIASALSRVKAFAVNAGENVLHKAKNIGSVATEVAGAVGSTVQAIRSAAGNLGSLAASVRGKVFEAASSKFGKRSEQKDPEPGQDNGTDTKKEQGISAETEPDDDLSQTAENPSTNNASGVLTHVYNGSNQWNSFILLCLKVFSSHVIIIQLPNML